MRIIENEVKDKEELVELLKGGKCAVISLNKENEPYIITLICGYDESKNAFYVSLCKRRTKTCLYKS